MKLIPFFSIFKLKFDSLKRSLTAVVGHGELLRVKNLSIYCVAFCERLCFNSIDCFCVEVIVIFFFCELHL